MAEVVDPYVPSETSLSPDEKKCADCGSTINIKAEICPKCGVRQRKPVSKAALLLITFFLGGLGAHKFYLGKNWQGVLYLLFFWTYIPALIALVEFIIYAFTSSERLNQKYSADGSAVVIVLVLFGVIMILGILAAIAIPAYQDYTVRAKIHGVDTDLREKAEDYIDRTGQSPAGMEEIGLSDENNYMDIVKDVQLNNAGHITVEFGSPVDGQTIVYEPIIVENSVADWVCTGGSLHSRYRPSRCREQ